MNLDTNYGRHCGLFLFVAVNLGACQTGVLGDLNLPDDTGDSVSDGDSDDDSQSDVVPPWDTIDRALVAVTVGDGKVHLGWRFSVNDAPRLGFDVFRKKKKMARIG